MPAPPAFRGSGFFIPSVWAKRRAGNAGLASTPKSEYGCVPDLLQARTVMPALSDFTSIAGDIAAQGYAVRPRRAMQTLFPPPALAEWERFAASWNDLGTDTYMADGGRYRRRRFAAFRMSGLAVARKPHQPHYQSRDYNPLNGGVVRWFDPVRDEIALHPVLLSLLDLCGHVFGAIAKPPAHDWHVEMHQFRIEASSGVAGQPTPEGLHRDGVEWVCVMLVNRINVSSGVTRIFGHGQSLGSFTLTDPLDAVFLDDMRVMHGVTPIAPLDGARSAFRDVLVLTFREDDPAPQ